MKTAKLALRSQKLISEIQLARLRLARANSAAEAAEKQAVLAKRRRREARQAARRAKKQVKAARAEMAEAQDVLAKLEKKLTKVGEQAAKSKHRASPEPVSRLREKKPRSKERTGNSSKPPLPPTPVTGENQTPVKDIPASSGVQVAVAPTDSSQPSRAL
jgi:hypothetical protein